MRFRSSFAILLTAIMIALSWSSSLCETSCVLPHDPHACCATNQNSSQPSVAQIQGCTHAPRLSAAQPVLSSAMAPLVVQILAVTPDAVLVTSQSLAVPRTASPPQFHLRI